MAKIILKDGSTEYLTWGACHAKVSAGEARWPKENELTYQTRELTAATPEKRKRRTKAEIAADAQAESDETE
jgi:hypothetical protein